MKLSRSEKQFNVFLRRSEHGAVVDLWLATHYDEKESDVEDHASFLERRDAFIWALERLLREDRVKLHRRGAYLAMSVADLVELFRKAWPASISESGYEDFYWWFFDPLCPAGFAWRQADGSYLIAD